MELSEIGSAVDARDLPETLKEAPYLAKIVRRIEVNNNNLEEILISIANRLSSIDASLYPVSNEVLDKPDKEPIRSFHSDMLIRLDKYGSLIERALMVNEGLKKLVG